MQDDRMSTPADVSTSHWRPMLLVGAVLFIADTLACLAFGRTWAMVRFFLVILAGVALWLIRGSRSMDLAVLKCLVALGVMSVISLPFLDAVWVGEIPLVALVQIPKVEFAHEIQDVLIRHVLRPLGLSRSPSPDSILTRPYALAIAYLIPLGLLLPILWKRTRMARPFGYWAGALLLLALLDYVLTLLLAGGPGFSMY
ncbi:MAG TPA: hypothetical protein VM165_19000 [Planctomycetaceae bacterium]|nr:hypothetical protein [Planctomycetaceae bacterium]